VLQKPLWDTIIEPYFISKSKIRKPYMESKKYILHRTIFPGRQHAALFDLPVVASRSLTLE
jgi:hypothetical protein